MPVLWVHRERVGVRESDNNNCMNSNTLILSFYPSRGCRKESRREKGHSVYRVAMRIHVPCAGTAAISPVMHDIRDNPIYVYGAAVCLVNHCVFAVRVFYGFSRHPQRVCAESFSVYY